MNTPDIISLFKDILLIIGLLFGAYLSIRLFRKFTPVVEFEITPKWSELHQDIVILKIEIRNKSKVQITVDRTDNKGIKFKILKRLVADSSELKEWVDIKDAEQICTSTRCLYPGEIVKVERLYRCTKDELLQGIIQFNATFSNDQKFLVDTSQERWTSTFIVVK
jgi:hypothetical protein